MRPRTRGRNYTRRGRIGRRNTGAMVDSMFNGEIMRGTGRKRDSSRNFPSTVDDRTVPLAIRWMFSDDRMQTRAMDVRGSSDFRD